ncbi:hypothetical protein FACS1894160_0310 [Bacteroidia bacterium]|nr:hypothetical protein FACS1894160_0310 [Bacteroidia bacterium]
MLVFKLFRQISDEQFVDAMIARYQRIKKQLIFYKFYTITQFKYLVNERLECENN